MALIPFAEHKLIPAGSNDPTIIPIGIIWHVDAGNVPDLWDYFAHRSGGIESHGHVRLDGHLFQYRDSEREADANYRANSFVGADGRRYGFLSFETQGLEFGLWTPEQLATMHEVNEWGHDVHGIAMRVCPGPFDGGIGYHTLFGAPGPWTPVSKSCPGPHRKTQFHNIIAPRLAGGTTNQEDLTIMDAKTKQYLDAQFAASKRQHQATRKAVVGVLDAIDDVAVLTEEGKQRITKAKREVLEAVRRLELDAPDGVEPTAASAP